MPPVSLFCLKFKSLLSHICYLNAAIIASFLAGRLDTTEDVGLKLWIGVQEKKDSEVKHPQRSGLGVRSTSVGKDLFCMCEYFFNDKRLSVVTKETAMLVV